MAELTSQERAHLPKHDFAIPERRAYPINDPSHARNALARVSAFGSPSDKQRVCHAVAVRYPKIHSKSCTMPGHVREAERI